jgi:hypothetical protein
VVIDGTDPEGQAGLIYVRTVSGPFNRSNATPKPLQNVTLCGHLFSVPMLNVLVLF